MQRLAELRALVIAMLLVGSAGSMAAQEPAQPASASKPKPAPKPVADDPLGPVSPDEPEDEAKAVISLLNGTPAPAKWPVGIPIGLSAQRSVKGNKPGSAKWIIDPAWVDQYAIRLPNGDIIIGTDEPVVVTVQLMVAKGDIPAFHVLKIQTFRRKPTPGPDPAPEPDPSPPPGPAPPDPAPAPPPLAGDAKKAYDLVTATVQLNATRKAVLVRFADNFMTVAGEISRGVAGDPQFAALKDVRKATARLTELNKSVMAKTDPEVAAWMPFFRAVDTWLDEVKAAGGLQDATAYAGMFPEIAKGMKAAGK